jgi:hypothetical protein
MTNLLRARCTGEWCFSVQATVSACAFACGRMASLLDSPDVPFLFWEKMREYFDVVAWQEGGKLPAYLPRQYLGEIDERPRLIEPLRNQWSYDVAASLARVV